jgi:hypothetical protein
MRLLARRRVLPAHEGLLRPNPDGARWWIARAAGYPQALPVFRADLMERYPPLTVMLDDAGKVQLRAVDDAT